MILRCIFSLISLVFPSSVFFLKVRSSEEQRNSCSEYVPADVRYASPYCDLKKYHFTNMYIYCHEKMTTSKINQNLEYEYKNTVEYRT